MLCKLRIKYLVHYYDDKAPYKIRNYSPAAKNKADYIISALNRIGISVDVISPALTKDGSEDKGGIYTFGDNTIKFFSCINKKNFFFKVISFIKRKTDLLFYLFDNIKKDDIVLVYHSLYFLKEVTLIKKIKRFKLLLETEEIYGDVLQSDKIVSKEIKFFKNADAYIFPTQLLNKKINVLHKPYVIIHGTYQVEPNMQECIFDNNLQSTKSGIIHCVYAGTLDPRKGGAIAAATAAADLSSDYYIHILGFGTEKEIYEMNKLVEDLAERCCCKVTYDGLLSGDEYIKFLQSCDIGLSTQDPTASFNDSSFPSKILSYMANGLRVVSIRIPAVETSAIGNYMNYYEKQTFQEIAEAIKNVNFNDEYDGREIISALDKKFLKDLKGLLEAI